MRLNWPSTLNPWKENSALATTIHSSSSSRRGKRCGIECWIERKHAAGVHSTYCWNIKVVHSLSDNTTSDENHTSIIKSYEDFCSMKDRLRFIKLSCSAHQIIRVLKILWWTQTQSGWTSMYQRLFSKGRFIRNLSCYLMWIYGSLVIINSVIISKMQNLFK